MKRQAVQLCALFLVGFALRIGVSALSGTLTSNPRNYYIHLDEGVVPDWIPHHTTAHGFGNQYANATLFRISGLSEKRYRILLCVVGAMIPLLILLLAQRLLPPSARGAPALAAWMAVFLPPLLMLSATWWHTLIPVILVLVHLITVLGVVERPWRWSAASSVAGWLLLLTRPDYYLAGAFVALARKVSWRHRIATVIFPILLLLVHNTVIARTSLPWSGSMWENLDSNYHRLVRDALIGYGPERWTTESAMSDDIPPEERTGPLAGNEFHKMRVSRFVRNYPGLLAEAVAMKIAKIFDVKRDGAMIQSPLENISYTIPLLALLILAAVGYGILLRDPASGRSPLWLLLMFLGYAAPMVAFTSLDRTRVPIHVLWIALAAYAACWFAGSIRKSGRDDFASRTKGEPEGSAQGAARS
ncbi:MAG: hypothetical protein HYT87_10060 [Nitrospirae bacterium]|nr:hypothetical protein [Nitrospirota bacterium]